MRHPPQAPGAHEQQYNFTMNTTIRKVFLGSLIGATLVTSAALAAPAAAQSVGDLQQQIQELLAKVATLQEQLRVALANQNTNQNSGSGNSGDISGATHRICGVLPQRSLGIGVSGSDVSEIQQFLKAEGYFSANATGYFGPATASAVAKWQAAQGLNTAGAFGPLSRERLKIWCGNQERFSATPTNGSAPLSVTFSTWISGFRINTVSYTIDFGDGTHERAADCPAPADACTGPGQNTHTYQKEGLYTATLNKVTDPCAGIEGCMAPVQTEIVAKRQIRVGNVACTKEYRPVCGSKPIVCVTTPCNPIQQTYSNRCLMEVDGATFVHEGACRDTSYNPQNDPKCKSWYDGCNSCAREYPGGPAICTLRACTPESMTRPYCTAYFDNNSGNRPPTISSFSGPTTLSAGERGTWTILASDPENQSLTYSISWGDESQTGTAAPSYLRESFVQTSTFTHSYARAGTYTVVIVVQDTSGQQSKTSTTVRVGSGAVACTMEYAPVCGRPAGCANTCPPGMYCAAICQLHDPVTYGNRCTMNVAGATFLHEGECNASSGQIY